MLKNLMPSRTAKKSGSVLTDLDAILTQSVSFRLHGRVFEIVPVSTERFLLYSQKLSKFFSLKDKEGLSADELIDGYHEVISSLVPDVTRKDIADMTQSQIGALFQLVIDTVTGHSQTDEYKKKVLTIPSKS